MQSTLTINADIFNRALLLFLNYAINDELDTLTKDPNSLGVIFFFYRILADVALIGGICAFRKTAFSIDLIGMALICLVFDFIYLLSFLAYFKAATPYETLHDLLGPFNRIIYVLVTVRAAWPFIDSQGVYKNWPIFDFLGLSCKAMKMDVLTSKSVGREILFSYCAICFSVAVGLVLWHYKVRNLGLLQNTALIMSLGALADCSYKRALLAQARAKRAQRLAGRATRKVEDAKASAEAEAARLAGECQGLQAAVTAAQKIISQQMDVFAQAQDEQTKERARIAALEAVIAKGHGAVADAGLLREILNPDNPHYSIRMVACVKMFEYFQGKRIPGKSPKDAIAKYAMEHAEELGLLYKGEPSQNAADQCAFVLNWVNEGGAPRTQARAEETLAQPVPA